METITSTSNSNSNRKDFNKKESHMIETLRPSAPPNYGTATSGKEGSYLYICLQCSLMINKPCFIPTSRK